MAGIVATSDGSNANSMASDRNFWRSLRSLLKTAPRIESFPTLSWKTTVGPILENDLLMGETYDARRTLWFCKYNDSPWLPVTIADDPKIEIERSAGPPVRRQETIVRKPDATVSFRAGAIPEFSISGRT